MPLPAIFLLIFSICFIWAGYSLHRASVLSQIAPRWKIKSGPYLRKSYLDTILEVELGREGEGEGEMEEEVAMERIFGERVQRIMDIAEMCSEGPIVKKELIFTFGEDIGNLILSFLFSSFD